MKTKKTLTAIGVAILLCLSLTATLTSCKNKDGSDVTVGGVTIITDSGNGGDVP